MIKLINEVNGFASQIGHLVAMMSINRSLTIQQVQQLRADQLDFKQDDKSNSIAPNSPSRYSYNADSFGLAI